MTVWWIDAPPPVTASLVFRVGRTDETLATAGITHLTEHLALTPFHDAGYSFNGQVGARTTTFHATGGLADVTSFVSDVCRSLADLPLARLPTEAQVLRAEALGHETTNFERMLSLWHGPQGPGLLGYPELGIGLIGAADVEAWAARYFTKANAVLVMTAPPPDGLRLPLPGGSGLMKSVATDPMFGDRPTRQVRLGSQPAGVCLGAGSTRSTALAAGAAILGKRLMQRLRHELGLVYSVAASYARLTTTDAFVFFGVDCERHLGARVSSEFMKVLRDFARRGPTPDELDQLARDPDGDAIDADHLARTEVHRLAVDALCGDEVRTIEEIAATYRTLTTDEVVCAASEVIDRSYVIPHPDYDIGLTPRSYRDVAVKGRSYRSANPKRQGQRRLIVGRDGVSWTTEGAVLTVRLEDLELYEIVSPTRRILNRRPSGMLVIDADEWRKGDRALRELDALVPVHLVLRYPG